MRAIGIEESSELTEEQADALVLRERKGTMVKNSVPDFGVIRWSKVFDPKDSWNMRRGYRGKFFETTKDFAIFVNRLMTNKIYFKASGRKHLRGMR
jgi:hypothetical protein